jgi:PAS domain S-box-containing protein
VRKSDSGQDRLSRLRVNAWLLASFWTAVLAASLIWSISRERKEAVESARAAAREALSKDLAYRHWNLHQGGIQVPLDENASSSSLLSHIIEGDASTPSGKWLNLISPEYMTHRVHDVDIHRHGLRSHVTSLSPMKSESAPDRWEVTALQSFADGEREVSSVEKVGTESHLRLMWPILAGEKCLKCHGQRGDEGAEFISGISIDVPMMPHQSACRRRILAMCLWHTLIWSLGIAVIYLGAAQWGWHVKEKNRAEEALREGEPRFRHIYENAPVMMYSVDEEGCICDVNQKWLEETGYQREEVIGQKADFMLWGKDSRLALAQITPHSGEEGESGTVRCQYFRKNGSSMDVLVDRHTITDLTGKRVTLAVVHNITERNRAEAEKKTFTRLGTRLAGAASLESILAVVREESRRVLDWDVCHFSVRLPTRDGFSVVTFVHPKDGNEKVYSSDAWPETALGEEIRPVFRGSGVLIDRELSESNRRFSRFGNDEQPSASLIFVPVRSGDSIIGVMSVQSYVPGKYRQTHVQILRRIADAVAPALERSYAEQTLREQNVTLTLLNTVAQVTTGSMTPEETCDEIREVVRGAMPCDAFFVDFYDLEAGLVHSVRAYDTIDGEMRPISVPDSSLDPEGLLTRRVIKGCRPLLIHRGENGDDEEQLEPFGDRSRRSASLLFAPMVVGSRVIGLISTQSYTPQAYTDQDVSLLKAIARQTGPALEAAVLAKQLRQSEERFRTVFEAAADSIFMKDSSLRYTLVNPAMEALFKVEAKKFIGRTDVDLFGEEEAQQIEALDRRVLNGETVEEQHTQNVDGKPHTFHTVKVPMRDQAGTVIGVCGVARDITERQSLEDQLRQAAKLEAVGQLAGGIAHDFNNLLQGILGYAGMLKLSAKPGDKVYQSSEVIEKTAERACELTQQLLGFARRGKIQNVAVDLHETILDVISLLSRTIDKNITIVQNLRAKAAYVLGDPGQMQQVILNLAINARDAMPDGGKLTFETDVVFLDKDYCRRHGECGPGEYVLVSVSDSGRGIPKEIQERIFEPFFTTKQPGQGTGMGLAMVYGIVRNHGGSVRVYSEPDHGATFKIYVPLAAGFATPQSNAALVAPIRGTGHVLVIDDEEVVRSSVSNMLRRLGYRVTTANDGVEGVERYRELGSEIDLVIIDMIMPKKGGLDCFLTLKGMNPDIRAVLSTGYSLDGTAREVLDEGMMGIIQKPYRIGQLSEVVAAAIKGTRQTSA